MDHGPTMYLSNKQWRYMPGDGTGDALTPLNMFCSLVTQRFKGTQVIAWTVSDNIHDFKYIHVHFSYFVNKIMIFYCSVIFQTFFQRNAGHSYWVTKHSMLPKVTTNLLYKLQQRNPMINQSASQGKNIDFDVRLSSKLVVHPKGTVSLTSRDRYTLSESNIATHSSWKLMLGRWRFLFFGCHVFR